MKPAGQPEQVSCGEYPKKSHSAHVDAQVSL